MEVTTPIDAVSTCVLRVVWTSRRLCWRIADSCCLGDFNFDNTEGALLPYSRDAVGIQLCVATENGHVVLDALRNQ